MSKEVFTKAEELGKSIVASEEFKEVQKREKDLMGDPSAQALLKKFHELQKLQKEKQKNGKSLSKEEAREFEQVQLQIMENKTIKSFSEAQEKFQHMMNKTMDIIRKSSAANIAEE